MNADQRIVRVVLRDYRREREHGRKDPYYASRDVENHWARYLATKVVDAEVQSIEFASAGFRIARRLHELTVERAAVGGDTKFADMTPIQQYWQTGRLAVFR